jgi:hypothetical protein
MFCAFGSPNGCPVASRLTRQQRCDAPVLAGSARHLKRSLQSIDYNTENLPTRVA